MGEGAPGIDQRMRGEWELDGQDGRASQTSSHPAESNHPATHPRTLVAHLTKVTYHHPIQDLDEGAFDCGNECLIQSREEAEAIDSRFGIHFYPGRYTPAVGCIIPDYRQGDILDYLPPQKTAGGGIVILEEPEHLNWHRVGGRWSDHFSHVAGVAHTNYRAYAREHPQLPLVKDQLLRIFSVSYDRARVGRGRGRGGVLSGPWAGRGSGRGRG